MVDNFLKELEREAGVSRHDPECTGEPWYNKYGDCIHFFARSEASYADRVDSVLTVYRSIETDEPIGFQLKGIKAIIKKLGL